MDGDSGQQQSIAATVQEISERSTTLIREEIELAKAEVQQKFNQLIRGVVIGTVAGIFIGTALLFVLHGAAWLAWFELFGPGEFFWGFFLVAGVLLVLGGLAGWLAAKLFRSGAPPTPDLAVEEAKRIRETVESSARSERLAEPPGTVEETPVAGSERSGHRAEPPGTVEETPVGGGEV